MTPEPETVAAVVATVPTIALGFDLTITFGVIVTVVLALVGWHHTRWKAVHGRIDSQSERLDRHDGRIQSVEQTLNHLPAKADVHGIQLSLSEVQGDMREIRAALAAFESRATRQDVVLQRVEDFLLNKDSRR